MSKFFDFPSTSIYYNHYLVNKINHVLDHFLKIVVNRRRFTLLFCRISLIIELKSPYKWAIATNGTRAAFSNENNTYAYVVHAIYGLYRKMLICYIDGKKVRELQRIAGSRNDVWIGHRWLDTGFTKSLDFLPFIQESDAMFKIVHPCVRNGSVTPVRIRCSSDTSKQS